VEKQGRNATIRTMTYEKEYTHYWNYKDGRMPRDKKRKQPLEARKDIKKKILHTDGKFSIAC
jgi:hypothetical protein